uniref:Photosystem I assembly protein Ycf4 n=1 Tax=Hyalogonium fusiforme TaxID=2926373 RepID=A0A9E7V7K3_9CHLO|nr:photosystem I assembly protein Ycf4 [Hyalogonium fusiforme]
MSCAGRFKPNFLESRMHSNVQVRFGNEFFIKQYGGFSFMCILLGSSGFLLSGISSCSASLKEMNILAFLQVYSPRPVEGDVSFFSQGLIMCFYGTLGFLLSFYWWFNIFWNVGSGFVRRFQAIINVT